MDKSTHAVRLEQWTKLVQSCADSGLTKKEWCSQNNIKLKTYFYWQRRVRNHALMVKTAASSDPNTAFAEVRLQGAVPADSSVSEDAVAQGFHADVVIRSSTLTIEISNTASDRLLSVIGKVAVYAK